MSNKHSRRTTKRKFSQPLSKDAMAAKTAGLLSRLSGGLTDGEAATESDAQGLRLMIWRTVDAAVNGYLDLDDTNDMALLGNVAALASAEADDKAGMAAATEWNQVIAAIRRRHDKSGKAGVTGNEYQRLRIAADFLHEWIGRQPRARIRRAHNAAMALPPLSQYGEEIAFVS